MKLVIAIIQPHRLAAPALGDIVQPTLAEAPHRRHRLAADHEHAEIMGLLAAMDEALQIKHAVAFG